MQACNENDALAVLSMQMLSYHASAPEEEVQRLWVSRLKTNSCSVCINIIVALMCNTQCVVTEMH